jgi:hypothetical protein
MNASAQSAELPINLVRTRVLCAISLLGALLTLAAVVLALWVEAVYAIPLFGAGFVQLRTCLLARRVLVRDDSQREARLYDPRLPGRLQGWAVASAVVNGLAIPPSLLLILLSLMVIEEIESNLEMLLVPLGVALLWVCIVCSLLLSQRLLRLSRWARSTQTDTWV